MIIIDLIYNLSVLVALSVLSGFINSRYERGTLKGKILQGVLFGGVAIIGMLYPFKFTYGVIFDGRSIVISLCTLFFGPISGIISSLAAIGFRVFLGGGGSLTGSLVITASFLVGYSFHKQRVVGKFPSTKMNLYSFGFFVSAVMMGLMLTLPSLAVKSAFEVITFSVMIFYPLITMLIGKVLSDQEDNKIYLERINEEKTLYQTTLYSIGDGVITTDKNYKVSYLNPIAEELTGWSNSEVIGKSLEEVFYLINENGENINESPLKIALQKNSQFKSIDSIILHPRNGEEIPITFTSAPIENIHKQKNGVVFVFRDNSEEHLKKVLLESKLRLLEVSVNYSADDMLSKALDEVELLTGSEFCLFHFVDSTQTKFISVNSSSKTENKLQSTDFSSLSEQILKNYLLSGFVDKNQPLFFNNTAEDSEKKYFYKYNIAITRELHIPIFRNGILIALISLFNKNKEYLNKDVNIANYLFEITREVIDKKRIDENLKQSMKNFVEIFNSTSEAIFIHDAATGIVIDCNERALQIYGYEMKEEIVGNNIEKLSSGDSIYNEESAQSIIQQAIHDGPQIFEWKALKKDGSTFWVEVSLRNTEIGGKGRVLAVVRDISARKETEKELARKMNELERFNNFMVDRELKMIELKKEINELCEQLNIPKKY
jgi:PAS domain S-box-containing protein